MTDEYWNLFGTLRRPSLEPNRDTLRMDAARSRALRPSWSAHAEDSMSITLDHLTKRYDGRPVVSDVSLEVADGELFVLLGPSGSGKSTILRMIAGLIPVDSGHVVLRGADVTALPPQLRATGFVFQHYALFPHMTVAENVEFGLRIQKMRDAERRRRREELLELVGLSGLGSRLPRQLSGGQQQRVALARALAPRPSVLLLDEPFGALDAKIRSELRRALSTIHHELAITTIFVTHDQEEAFELGDRLGVMNLGRLLEVGPPSELYLRPQTEFTATFLGSANLLVGTTATSGIELGHLCFPSPVQSPYESSQQPVQILFRPEDIALTPEARMLADPPLGHGIVEQIAFVGAHQRLRLRLPPIPGVRPIAPAPPFGSDSILIEALRTQEQARRFPLRPGDTAWIGVHRVHTLSHPGLSLLLVTDGSPAGQSALSFGGRVAQLAHARGAILGAGLTQAQVRICLQELRKDLTLMPELETYASLDAPAEAIASQTVHCPVDVVVLVRGPENGANLVQHVLATGDHHALLVPPGGAPLPSSVLICVAGMEPSKEDVLFAGRLCRHLSAQVTLLTILTGDGEVPADAERSQRFLDAAARSLAVLGVPARIVVRSGPLVEVIVDEMLTGKYGLLVLGAPLRPITSARIRHFVANEVPYPVLIARSAYASPTRPSLVATTENSARSVEEMIS